MASSLRSSAPPHSPSSSTFVNERLTTVGRQHRLYRVCAHKSTPKGVDLCPQTTFSGLLAKSSIFVHFMQFSTSRDLPTGVLAYGMAEPIWLCGQNGQKDENVGIYPRFRYFLAILAIQTFSHLRWRSVLTDSNSPSGSLNLYRMDSFELSSSDESILSRSLTVARLSP